MESREGGDGPRRVVRLGLLALLLAPLLALKLVQEPLAAGHLRADATTYYLVARSVASGEGLRTPVSLYHQGLRELPALTPLHPLWPLVLGGAGKIIGLERAAALLPEVLYFADLLLVYLLGNRLAAELRRGAGGIPARLPRVDFGHLALLLLGSTPEFFKDTALCLTEALAFCLLLAALLALHKASRPRFAALAGALAGLSYLTRSQFVLVPVAIPLALLLAGRGRADSRRRAALAAASAALVTLPWIAFLVSLPGGFEPRVLIDFTAYRETPDLPRFRGFFEYDSLGARLADATAGLGVAFDPRSKQSYIRSFGWDVYLVPVALALSCLPAWRSLRSSAAERRSALLWGTGLTALASLLPVHVMHGNFPPQWFFGDRHGLPMILGILLSLAYFLAQRRSLRLVALALVAGTLWAKNPLGSLNRGPRGEGKKARIWPVERDLVAWLDAHERPPLAVSTKCRELALWSSARFHWIRCNSSPPETRSLFQNLPIDYLIVYSKEVDCAFHRRLASELELVKTFEHGSSWIRVLRWRGS